MTPKQWHLDVCRVGGQHVLAVAARHRIDLLIASGDVEGYGREKTGNRFLNVAGITGRSHGGDRNLLKAWVVAARDRLRSIGGAA